MVVSQEMAGVPAGRLYREREDGVRNEKQRWAVVGKDTSATDIRQCLPETGGQSSDTSSFRT